ncbi:MAG: hypothetical protein WCT18_03255 [Patescibacteria group bacterium]
MIPHPLIRQGYIEVIVGCMFSGKSEEAAKRVTKESFDKNRKLLIFTPRKANREVTLTKSHKKINTYNQMVSRSGKIFPAISFDENNPWEILSYVEDYLKEHDDLTTVVIEEAHFCDKDLVKVVKLLAEKYLLRVIVVGLDQTFDEEPFATVLLIMTEAEFVTKELAVCFKCGSQSASKSWLDTRALGKVEKGKILVGDKCYKPVCRHCYIDLQEKYPKK